ncbi:WXG100 family type VII secretion target [Amycolatopsis sp. FDAARGOS 1241]|uniref:WXG100 family type VII secretion target n=1 Tax=Amycolatopsis sp. FDAARGOS 1241 TaxID=2778070 RepID=UPI001951E62E|nr:WXG100 family type VII secretion target [Amycolatopsis sp. FDAARGOS 1241]QRP45356.1 WXG100 family type VII secretion target [Amycolatopsis sp. FDAARGOS 1241]
MAGGFTGDPAELTKASKQVHDNVQQLNGHKQQLLAKMESTRSLWQGDAARTFNEIMTEFDQDFKKVNDALADIADRLDKAGSAYSQNQDETNSRVKSLGSSGISSVLG